MVKSKAKFGVCVMNDNVNSFERVIQIFQDIFSWDITQAGNCATVIHNKGEYIVKVFDSEKAALFVAQLLRGQGLTTKLIIDKSGKII